MLTYEYSKKKPLLTPEPQTVRGSIVPHDVVLAGLHGRDLPESVRTANRSFLLRELPHECSAAETRDKLQSCSLIPVTKTEIKLSTESIPRR
jgi:hypothetical protein